jgi:CubicO group peptidase (beta-lactamase class C family)
MMPVRLNNGSTFSASYGWFLDTMHGHRILLHNGSTVGGFSSVVFYYPDDRLAVAVLMNVDRFDAVNVLAQRVAGQFIPALSAATIAEKADPDTALSRQFLVMIDNIANDRDSELLAPNLRNPGGPVRTNRARGFSGKVDKFAFLEREDLGPAGVVRFGNTIRYIYRYKLYAGDRLIYYTFETTPAGKVARFLAEEE